MICSEPSRLKLAGVALNLELLAPISNVLPYFDCKTARYIHDSM
jgi:hypothetical protein